MEREDFDVNDVDLEEFDFTSLRADFELLTDYVERVHGVAAKFGKAPPHQFLPDLVRSDAAANAEAGEPGVQFSLPHGFAWPSQLQLSFIQIFLQLELDCT